VVEGVSAPLGLGPSHRHGVWLGMDNGFGDYLHLEVDLGNIPDTVMTSFFVGIVSSF